MRLPADDLYQRLGVPPTAGAADLRRAYRLLALRFHPDRAGAESTLHFQRIAEAYRILADPATRAGYDGQHRGRWPRAAQHTATAPGRAGPGRSGAFDGPGGRVTWRTAGAPLLARLSGPLDALVARAAARRAPDGVLELLLTAAEAAGGGRAAIETTATITCPTCAGVAAHNEVWCCRCGYEGRVVDQVAIVVDIPADAPDRALYSFQMDPAGTQPLLRIRLRVT